MGKISICSIWHRSKLGWCLKSPSCSNETWLCRKLEEDFATVQKLKEKAPDRIQWENVYHSTKFRGRFKSKMEAQKRTSLESKLFVFYFWIFQKYGRNPVYFCSFSSFPQCSDKYSTKLVYYLKAYMVCLGFKHGTAG